MKRVALFLLMSISSIAQATTDAETKLLQQQILKLQKETQILQEKIAQLNRSIAPKETVTPKVFAQSDSSTISGKKIAIDAKKSGLQLAQNTSSNSVDTHPVEVKKSKKKYRGVHSNRKHSAEKSNLPNPKNTVHNAPVSVHSLDEHPEKVEFYPAALIADNHIVTYVAGMPVVSSPFLGARPAFDGSDYIVNISSINRDIRLMEQRRRLYGAFDRLDYPTPNLPIVTISGKVEPLATMGSKYDGPPQGDIDLGANELDVAAALNDKVEAYMAISYDATPPAYSGQRVANSSFNLNMGFVNIGDLDKSPIYFTAGQIYVPYGRYSTSMVSPTLPMLMSRTKNRPFILGYKSQKPTGPFAAIYGFSGDTTQGSSAVGGANLGYIFTIRQFAGEVGGSFISSLTNAGGMQRNGSVPGTTFAGFSSLQNGSENVRKTPGFGVHTSISFDRYNIIAEWVTATEAFRTQDLSFDGRGAQPKAGQVEGGMTFMSFNRPSSVAVGYQWSSEALALNLAAKRINAVYNISIWKDTVESLEYRHDIDYGRNQYANGAAPAGRTNLNTVGTGGTADTVLAQIGVYF